MTLFDNECNIAMSCAYKDEGSSKNMGIYWQMSLLSLIVLAVISFDEIKQWPTRAVLGVSAALLLILLRPAKGVSNLTFLYCTCLAAVVIFRLLVQSASSASLFMTGLLGFCVFIVCLGRLGVAKAGADHDNREHLLLVAICTGLALVANRDKAIGLLWNI